MKTRASRPCNPIPRAPGWRCSSFLGAGYTHTDGKYRNVVARGLGYLLAHQKPDGDLFLPGDPRSSSERLALQSRHRLDRSVRSLWHDARSPAASAGAAGFGFHRRFAVARRRRLARIRPRHGSDTSVSGWQLMALKSGELAGLSVPGRTYAMVTRWLDHAQGAGGDPSRYAYRPNSTQAHQREPSRVMTAEALLMRQYLGWRRDTPDMIEGAEWLRDQSAPVWPAHDVATQRRARCLLLVLRDAGHVPDARRLLAPVERPFAAAGACPARCARGHWPAVGIRSCRCPDRWGYWGGRLYLTSMHLLMLEVYYRHLPIYQNLGAAARSGFRRGALKQQGTKSRAGETSSLVIGRRCGADARPLV